MNESVTKTITVTTGERFLYENETRHILVQFSVKRKIDADCLRQAADAMMERCPYYHTKAVLQNNRYLPLPQRRNMVAAYARQWRPI